MRNVSLRDNVLTQFQLNPEDVTLDFRVSQTAVARKRWGNHYEQPTKVGLELCRNRVPEDVITLDQSEIDKDLSGDNSASSDSCSDDSSSDNDASTEIAARSSLSDDIEQYKIMQVAYQKVGLNYEVNGNCLVGGIGQLQALEGVPCRWPLAQLTFPLRKVIDQLDRVLAGCCWEVLISTPKLSKSLQLPT